MNAPRGKWGFIDPAGKQAVPFKYDEASSFTDGLAKVVRKNKVFYIDRRGVEYIK
jgi:hypothetical protein